VYRGKSKKYYGGKEPFMMREKKSTLGKRQKIVEVAKRLNPERNRGFSLRLKKREKKPQSGYEKEILEKKNSPKTVRNEAEAGGKRSRN